MTSRPAHSRIRFYSGWRALPIRLKFLAYLGKCHLQNKKYPLFKFSSSRGGAAKTFQILRELRICKTIKFDRVYYFGLSSPHWPSRPFDRLVADGGLNIALTGTPSNQHLDMAVLGITRRCPYRCRHCYEYENIADQDSVPGQRWKSLVRELQELGTGNIVLSGGEPMIRYEDLIELLEAGDKNQSDFHLHTSGYGVTPAAAAALKDAGLVAAGIGLDDVRPERHDSLRGFVGAHAQAMGAVRCFQEAGIFPYVNMCLTKELVRSGDLGSYLDLLKELGIGIVRFLEPKPWGGYSNQDAEDLFSHSDRESVTRFYEWTSKNKTYKDHPLISYEAYVEAPERLGCLMGGLSHLYIDSGGNVEPCVFLPISFGNIMGEDFKTIFLRMRKAIPEPLHAPCPSLQLAAKIKAKIPQAVSLPVPFQLIEKEWEEMFKAARSERRKAL